MSEEFATQYSGGDKPTFDFADEIRLEQIIDEMISYARTTEFDYYKARDEAIARADISTETLPIKLGEEESEIIRARGQTNIDYMKQFTRFVIFENTYLQLVYYEFRVEEEWVGQTQIVMSTGDIFNDNAAYVAGRFAEQSGKDYMMPEGVPDHVTVFFQKVDR